MRIASPALIGFAALLWFALGAHAEDQNLATLDSVPPTADAPPTAGASPAGAQPAPTAAPAPPAAKKPAPKPDQKSASLEPTPKIYMPKRLPPGPDNVDTDGIAATVGDVSISEYEVRQRMALFLATSGIRPNKEQLKRIRSQIIVQLENEKLELQEAIKQHISVSRGEVDQQIDRMLSQNHLTLAQLREVLSNAGASEEALRTQLTAQLAWQKTVSAKYQGQIHITPAEVNAELDRYAQGANKPHYLVSEIFIPVDNPDKDAEAHKDAENVEAQLKSGGDFATVAHQFSQSPSAAAGGDIGWIYEGQLAPELNAALKKMKVHTITPPIRSIGGYYILALRAKQEPMGTKIVNHAEVAVGPDTTLPLARLLLPLGPSPSKEMLESAMKIATNLRAHFSGCDMLANVPKKLQGAVFMNLGEMKVGDLSPAIQKALAATQSGEAAPPFQSEAGVELIARCDKRVTVQTAYKMPTRQQVEDQLFQEQISAMARRYMRDLRRGADVEVR